MSYTETQTTQTQQTNQTRFDGLTPAPEQTGQQTTQQSTQPNETLDPFQLRYDTPRRLPRELREEAMGMTWSLFTATYAPTPTVKFSDITATRENWCYTTYAADVTRTSKTFPPQTEHREVTASGPAHAFSAMLAEEGRYVEILEFHQFELFEAKFTAIKVAHQIDERNTAWAVGFGTTSEISIASAMASGAQRIYG
ncbi:acetyl-CoA acetyltransferase [Corynebacterium tuscaniense]|uniref:acetyl-CoA acetyltransferase n=1 Tax=Corynebacterium tuscaniense TaxID=302449 RepID=UPI000A9C61B5|nr:acetyl-CoA acetyltransferase [Corynebacterium tuscaniense]